MDYNEIRRLVKLVETSGISELEIKEGDSVITIKKGGISYAAPVAQPMFAAPAPVVHTQSSSAETPVAATPTQSANLHEIKSPIVGSYYSAPSPDAEPFVKVGDMINTGKVMCIIEAMKLMNEIESDVSGKVVEIKAQNGKPVEYGQTLFVIELS